MRNSTPALHNKIKPFFSHRSENKRVKILQWSIKIFVDYTNLAIAFCPAFRMFLEVSAVKFGVKIFVIFCNPYLRDFDYLPP